MCDGYDIMQTSKLTLECEPVIAAKHVSGSTATRRRFPYFSLSKAIFIFSDSCTNSNVNLLFGTSSCFATEPFVPRG